MPLNPRIRVGSVNSVHAVGAFANAAVQEAATEFGLNGMQIVSTTTIPYLEDNGSDALLVVVVVAPHAA